MKPIKCTIPFAKGSAMDRSTLTSRYLKQQKTGDALSLLHAGAIQLLNYKQTGSGFDLAMRMVEVLQTDGLTLDDVNKGEMDVNSLMEARILEIFQAFPLDDEKYVQDYVRAIMRWSSKFGNPAGDPALHHAFGSRFYKGIINLENSAKMAGKMAFEWSQQGYVRDGGYFITRLVLQYLAQKKLKYAYTCFENYLKAVKEAQPNAVEQTVVFRSVLDGTSAELPVLVYPLSNFTHLLLYTIQREAVDQFTLLRAQYRENLSIDDYLYQAHGGACDERLASREDRQPPKRRPVLEKLK
ncbi:hypothetical protein HDU96_000678 [Phlyctochytrium bullatum]|nr:hypothetical protein HDU96_000678 [Phlyctochytrium bullatum]